MEKVITVSSENKAVKAMKAASKIAAEIGLGDLTLNEINAEILEVRNKK
mgnify:FL=1